MCSHICILSPSWWAIPWSIDRYGSSRPHSTPFLHSGWLLARTCRSSYPRKPLSRESRLVRSCKAMALAQVCYVFIFSACLCWSLDRRLEVRLPRTWLSLVEEIAWNYEEETVDSVMEQTMKAAANAAIQSSNAHSNKLDARLEESMFFDHLDFPDTTISMDLLSPVPSRNPSPRRLRPKSKSPARWKLLKSINDAVQSVMNSRANGVYGEFNFLSHLLFLIFCPQFKHPETLVPDVLSVT